MLFLMRRPGEKIRIGDNIEVIVNEIKYDKSGFGNEEVVIGINAPKEVIIKKAPRAIDFFEKDDANGNI